MSCEQCTSDPWLNLSSEIPDRDRNINIVNFVQRPPLGWDYRAVGCQRTCVSEDSQLEADLCALAQAQECLYSDWSPPRTPGTPFQPPTLYTNLAQTCIIQCSNGQEVSVGGENTFSWTIPAGTVVALSEAEANVLANSLACQQARRHRICISSTLAGGCKDTVYRQRIIATGGTPAFFPFVNFIVPSGCQADVTAGDRGSFSPIPYTWSLISGTLPPGLELRPCTGYIKGTPTTAGIYTFTVKAVDAIGSFQIRTISLTILEITTDAELPDAVLDEPYSEALTVSGSPGSEVWALLSGELPPGLSITSSGFIEGTPTGPLAGYQFTAKVTVNNTVCQKQFNIETTEINLLAYWKLDETTGNRADSKNDNDLVPNGTVGSDTGKIGNAFKQTVAGTNRIEVLGSNTLLFDPTKGLTVCGWMFLVSTGTFSGVFSWILKDNVGNPLFDVDLQRITTADPPPDRLYASICDSVGVVCYNIKLDATVYYNAWTFFRLWYEPDDNKLKLKINEGTTNELVVGFTIPSQITADFEIGRSGPDYLVDEVAVYEGVLSDEDGAALYNSGTGITYPNIPHP